MPGESTTCIGCHEDRTASPSQTPATILANRRAPSKPQPFAGIPDVIDYPRDVQPVWNRNCVTCHNTHQRKGDVSLVGDRTPLYSISYYTITAKSLVADGRNLPKSNYPPYALGTSASKLLEYCDPSHHDVQLTERERRIVKLWIETGATYPGTYAGLGSGMIGGYAENSLDRRDIDWPEMKASLDVLNQRCVSCHTTEKNMPLALSPSDEIINPPWEPLTPNDARRKFSRQLLYNLTNPKDSVLLLAPLSKSAGGYESCGKAVFESTDDPDYQTVLAAIERTKQQLNEIKRFDMPDFIPRPQYVREMKKYNILPRDTDPDQAFDTYQLEQDYWQSLWYKPIGF
jgi:cytochrome c553